MIHDYDIDDFDREEDDDEPTNSYTVSMKGAPNMATVQWANTEAEAIAKTAREWRCKPDELYIYKGEDQ